MITDMASELEGLTEAEIKNLGIVINWVSKKIGNMAETLHEFHRENEKFQEEFDRKQEIIERQLYGLRGRDYQTYRA